MFRLEFEGCEAQILANLPRVPVKAFGDILIAAQARDFRNPVESCGDPNFAYYHPYQCGYPQYSEPVYLDGAWVHEPLYYRTYAGSRYFWWHGGWHQGHGTWDGRHFDRDHDRY